MVKKIALLSLALLVSIAVAQQKHTVRRGDTLWDLSAKYLDNPFDWPRIYGANTDQIADPHWIFPGQEFLIPGRVMETEGAEESAAYVGTRVTRGLEFETRTQAPSEEELESQIEEELPAESTMERKVELWRRQGYIVSPALVYRAGYIAKDLPQWGEIVHAEATRPQKILTHHEVLVNRGARDMVVEGDLFTILRIGRGVKNPRTKESLGRIVHVMGTLTASSVEEESFRGLVEEAYDHIRVGDLVIPYMEMEIPPARELVDATRSLEGTIVAELERDERLMPSDIVFIDKGRLDGIHPGDVFEIYRPGRTRGGVADPERIVGEIQVLGVRDETSSGVVNSIDNSLDLRVGELIRLTKEGI